MTVLTYINDLHKLGIIDKNKAEIFLNSCSEESYQLYNQCKNEDLLKIKESSEDNGR